ncbi:MAG: NfeD family protein, partial [Bacteroidales bacterium]|nr:NfeD family protein [Bacteroidales bacterium]
FPSDSNYQMVEEDVDAIGSVVEVISTVYQDNNSGRIMFNGTSWQAVSNKGIIEAGTKAKLVHRDNISWVVVPWEEE